MEIRELNWQQALPIRHKVLWPDKEPLFCKVEGDEEAQHYGVYIDNKLVCVASIYIESCTGKSALKSARLRKFATLVEFQGKGIGTNLIKHIIDELKKSAVQLFWCDARKSALSFYRKFAMQSAGQEFIKSGVVYQIMQLQLTD